MPASACIVMTPNSALPRLQCSHVFTRIPSLFACSAGESPEGGADSGDDADVEAEPATRASPIPRSSTAAVPRGAPAPHSPAKRAPQPGSPTQGPAPDVPAPPPEGAPLAAPVPRQPAPRGAEPGGALAPRAHGPPPTPRTPSSIPHPRQPVPGDMWVAGAHLTLDTEGARAASPPPASARPRSARASPPPLAILSVETPPPAPAASGPAGSPRPPKSWAPPQPMDPASLFQSMGSLTRMLRRAVNLAQAAAQPPNPDPHVGEAGPPEGYGVSAAGSPQKSVCGAPARQA